MKAIVGFCRKTIIIGATIFLLFVLVGCGGGGGAGSSGSDSTPVTISVSGSESASALAAEAVPADVEKFRFTVSAVDMSSMTNTVSVAGGSATVTLDVPNGDNRTFLAEALDSSDTVIYSGSTTASLAGDPVTLSISMAATSATVNAVIGDWGFARLERDGYGVWHSEGGTMSYGSDGTEALTSWENAGGSLSSHSESASYDVAQNSDGSLSITEAGPGGSETHRAFASDDWSMLLADGTQGESAGAQTLLAAVRVDGEKSYSTADVYGLYYFIGYRYNPSMPRVYDAFAGTMTSTGDGYCFSRRIDNGDGYLSRSSSSAALSVEADGSFQVDGAGVGHIGGDGKVLVSSSADDSGRWATVFFMKSGDKAYSTADLSGTWALAGFGDSGGTVFRATAGTMTCDASGICSGSVKDRDSTGAATTEAFSLSLSVAPDGSFGKSIAPDAPYYAGAIGNGGNTIIINNSFDSAELDRREVLLAVRCSGCIGL